MSMQIRDYILHHKIAPKAFQCSSCGKLVEKSRVYTKTNAGRYCASCGEELSSVPAFAIGQ